jgi:hypothetical protein
MGTDCGFCMAACPFSHQDNAIHNAVRRLARAMPGLAPAFVWADDLFYGCRWKGAQRPGGGFVVTRP